MKKITRIMASIVLAATMTVSTGICASANGIETAYDSQFLNDMGLAPDRFGNFHVTFHWSSDSKMVDSAWAKVGVVCTTTSICSNKYVINGKKVSREEAYRYAAAKLGRTIDYSKYDPEIDKQAARYIVDAIEKFF